MPKKYDVVAITGTYQKDGQDKARYQNVGMVIEKDGKFYLKMNHLVTIHDDGHTVNFFNLFTPQPRQSNQTQSGTQQTQSGGGDYDDDIPF